MPDDCGPARTPLQANRIRLLLNRVIRYFNGAGVPSAVIRDRIHMSHRSRGRPVCPFFVCSASNALNARGSTPKTLCFRLGWYASAHDEAFTHSTPHAPGSLGRSTGALD